MSNTNGAPQVELNTDYPPIKFDADAPQNTGNVNQNLNAAKDKLYTGAQNAYDTIQNHPVTQNVKDTVANGEVSPVAQNVRAEANKTSNEFGALYNARQTPDRPAATGQPLTHYHSMFNSLLSWENPRATGVSYILTILFIFAARYLNILHYVFKATWITLGITAAAEIAGKLVFNNGLTSQMRPRKYYTIPRESLERMTEDVEQLINFFVIETQRVIFAENIYVTMTVFFAAFSLYWLIRVVPLWGLSLILVNFIYLTPLIYLSNKEVIDTQLKRASTIISDQANQVKGMAAQHTGQATETVKSYAGQYSQKAQDLIGQARRRSMSPNQAKDSAISSAQNAYNSAKGSVNSGINSAQSSINQTTGTSTTGTRASDFPKAPNDELPPIKAKEYQSENPEAVY